MTPHHTAALCILKRLYSKSKLLIALLFFAIVNSINAQTTPNYTFSAGGFVGCQTLVLDPNEPKRGFSFEDIKDTDCLKVCKNTEAEYYIYELDTNSNFTVFWEVNGGEITGENNTNQTKILWGNTGTGSIKMTISNSDGSTTEKTICIETIEIATPSFAIAPSTDITTALSMCSEQEIYFTNLSSANNGSSMLYHSWDFGDGSYSSEFSPTHSYTTDGTYTIRLTVTNACNCSSTIEREIVIGKKGINISCPTVVCSEQIVNYSIPNDIVENCGGNGIWSVIGGDILKIDKVNISVNWNQTDTDGFGYVTFDPSYCGVGCLEVSTIKIPVVQNIGTIKGVTTTCVGAQERYILPQWPSTYFQWEIVGNDINNNLANVMLTDQGNEIVIEPKQGGVLTLRCVYYNTLLKCGGTASFTINVGIPVTITGLDEVCQGASTSFETNPLTLKNWVLKNESNVIVNQQNDVDVFNFTFTAPGVYSLSVNGQGVCPGTSKNITVVGAAPIPNIAGLTRPNEVCPNLPYTFSLPNNPGFEYHWSVSNGGTFIGGNIGNSVSIKFDTAATRTVFVVSKRTENATCLPSAPLAVVVNTKQIPAQITDNLPQAVCANSFDDFVAFRTATTTPYIDNGTTFSWSITPSTAGSITEGQDTNSIKVLWNNSTLAVQATLSLTLTNCTVSRTITKAISIGAVPTFDITGVNSVCAKNPIILTLFSTNGAPITPTTQVEWDMGDGNVVLGTGNIFTYEYENTFNPSTTRIIKAKIINNGGCAVSSTVATKNITVIASPNAAASISIGGNSYCLPQTINTQLTATFAPSTATIQWFKEGSSVVLGTGATLTITNASNMGFGTYYFKAANAQICQINSNSIAIVQNCLPPPPSNCPPPIGLFENNSAIDCSVPNNSTNCNCRQINLIAILPTNAISSSWLVKAPYGDFNVTSTNFQPSVPGDYITILNIEYLCNGQTISSNKIKTVTVPYFANFNYAAKCSVSNNFTYDIDLTDNSPFYAPVATNTRTYNYYRSTSAAGPWTLVASTPNATLTNQNPGNYFFKLVVSGALNGVQQAPCEQIINVNIRPLAATSIVVDAIIPCDKTAVQFSPNSVLGAQSYLWTFEPGVTSTLAEPQRVFDTSGVKTITCEITTTFGCKTTLTRTITIPPKCFDGTLIPIVDPTVCEGTPVTLTYVPKPGDCAIVRYEWKRKGMLFRTTTVPTTNVLVSDSYTVTVVSAQGCKFTPTNTVEPGFIKPMAVELLAPATICSNSPLELKAITNAANIQWTINGSYEAMFDNQKTISVGYGLPAGNIPVTVTIIDNFGCPNSATSYVTVLELPTVPTLTYDKISCNPFLMEITAQGSGPFNWSNGMTGSSIIVNQGGIYKAVVNLGNCSTSASITLPKNPQNYLWTFPSGCIAVCERDTPSIFGPIASFDSWSWTLQNNTSINGNGDVIPLDLTQTASDVISLNLHNGFCGTTSKNLNLTKTQCEKCDIQFLVTNTNIETVPFCQYNITADLFNLTNSPLSIVLSSFNNNLVFQAATYVLQPGNNIIMFTVTPINGFNGGSVQLTVNGLDNSQVKCLSFVPVYLPQCSGFAQETSLTRTKVTDKGNKVVISPNPATNFVNINYETENADATITIYDLLGKQIATHQTKSAVGSWTFDTQSLQAGVYIVVFKNALGIQSQHKLIKQ